MKLEDSVIRIKEMKLALRGYLVLHETRIGSYADAR